LVFPSPNNSNGVKIPVLAVRWAGCDIRMLGREVDGYVNEEP